MCVGGEGRGVTLAVIVVCACIHLTACGAGVAKKMEKEPVRDLPNDFNLQ